MAGFDIHQVIERVNADGADLELLPVGARGMCVQLELLRVDPDGGFTVLLFEPFYDQGVNYMHRLEVEAIQDPDDDQAVLRLRDGNAVMLTWPAEYRAWQKWLAYKRDHAVELLEIAARALEYLRPPT